MSERTEGQALQQRMTTSTRARVAAVASSSVPACACTHVCWLFHIYSAGCFVFVLFAFECVQLAAPTIERVFTPRIWGQGLRWPPSEKHRCCLSAEKNAPGKNYTKSGSDSWEIATVHGDNDWPPPLPLLQKKLEHLRSHHHQLTTMRKGKEREGRGGLQAVPSRHGFVSRTAAELRETLTRSVPHISRNQREKREGRGKRGRGHGPPSPALCSRRRKPTRRILPHRQQEKTRRVHAPRSS